MMFPIIKVRDNETGHVHVVGTNTHDTLYIDDKTGGIHYHNLQNCEGTMKIGRHNTYEFVGKSYEWEPYVQVEFVTFDQLIEIYKQNIAMSCEQERHLRDMIKTFIEEERAKHRLDEDEGEINHTGGNYRY